MSPTTEPTNPTTVDPTTVLYGPQPAGQPAPPRREPGLLSAWGMILFLGGTLTGALVLGAILGGFTLQAIIDAVWPW